VCIRELRLGHSTFFCNALKVCLPHCITLGAKAHFSPNGTAVATGDCICLGGLLRRGSGGSWRGLMGSGSANGGFSGGGVVHNVLVHNVIMKEYAAS